MESQPPLIGNMFWEEQCDFLELPGSVQLHHQQTGDMIQLVQEATQLCPDFSCNEIEMVNGFGTYISVTNNGGSAEQTEPNNCDDMVFWPRVKWTEKMVKTMITILSYVGDETAAQCGSWKEKVSQVRKIGKWRCISRVMLERGYNVSPQQCEDKFNSLNKTYKKLNELLGKCISCKVVKNPEVLGVLDISAKVKAEVKKILASKHVFFEEMCSYHDGNRLFIPQDSDVLQSLVSVLQNKGTFTGQTSSQICEAEGGFNVLNDTVGVKAASLDVPEDPGVWIQQLEVYEVADLGNTSIGNRSFQGQEQCRQTNIGLTQPEMISPAAESSTIQEEYQLMEARVDQLEEQKLKIKAKALKLKMQWLQVEETNLAENFELEKVRVESKRLKLANKYAELKLERKAKQSKEFKTQLCISLDQVDGGIGTNQPRL